MGTFVKILTNESPEFYRLMGPFLSRRLIVRDLGAPVWDDDWKVWFVSLLGKTVVGFGAVVFSKETAKLCSFWVAPDTRGKKVFDGLLAKILPWLAGKVDRATAVATPEAVHGYLKHGFTEAGRRGRYTVMERTV